MWIKNTNGEQRKLLAAQFEPAMFNLSKICALVWSDLEHLDSDSDHLDHVLMAHFFSIPNCHLIYAVDKFGKQISSNINGNGIDSSYRTQDLSRRPFSFRLEPKRHFMLSSVYISQNTGRPCISAVQPVNDEQHFLGFIVADFDIYKLPLSPSKILSDHKNIHSLNTPYELSQLHRVSSPFDRYFSEIQGILHKLITEHGVFNCTLHYASAQAMLWQIDAPYQYSLYDLKKLLDPDMYLTYPRCSYPANAKMSTKTVKEVLERFCTLRLIDDRFYLRSGSLNVMNGLVGLTFSFDGTQYLSVETFLSKDLADWFAPTTI